MEVILLDNFGKLGDLGDKVSVKAGYGRNYLIPYGKAIPADKENLARFEERRAELEKVSAESKNVANARATELEGCEISILVKAGEEGKLFGSVGTREIIEALEVEKHEIEKSEIRLPDGAIRELGEYTVDLQLHSDVTVPIKVNIVAES